jgi:cell division control protein 24
VSAVTSLVDRLPPDVFTAEEPLTPPSLASSYPSFAGSSASFDSEAPSASVTLNSKDQERRNIILELINTERKYVGDLEVMQVCARQLVAP